MGTATVDETLIALPPDRAAALADVSQRRVDYWAAQGLVRPTFERRLGERRRVRLYGHLDLLCLLVTVELLDRGISLQAIRRIVEHLRSRGYERPLSELRFAVDERDKQVYFLHPDGTWEGGRKPDQTVIRQVLELTPLRARIRAAARRDNSTVGQAERRRGAMGSKPVIKGTRVPVDTVRRYLEHGASTDEVLRSFPVLQRRDVEAVRRGAI